MLLVLMELKIALLDLSSTNKISFIIAEGGKPSLKIESE